MYASPSLRKYMEKHKPSYRLPGSSEPDEEEETAQPQAPQQAPQEPPPPRLETEQRGTDSKAS